jgi:hypothetical protein
MRLSTVGTLDILTPLYAPEDFCQWTAAYLDKVDISQATIVGISMGGRSHWCWRRARIRA